MDLTATITSLLTLKLPLISINMSDVTEHQMAIALASLGGLGFIHRFNRPEVQADIVSKVIRKNLKVGAAVGIKEGYIERSKMLVKAGAKVITIDVAHGAMKKTILATNSLKKEFGNKVDIIPGVIATYDGANRLFKAGADCVRVGLGPGTICTTRTQTGVGVPQISALLDAAKAAKENKKTILCDGGTKNSGDIVKGLAAGASAVVIGSQFAGTNEAPGKIVVINGKKMKTYNASTSFKEKKNHQKKIRTDQNYINHIEGVESYVENKGTVKKVVIRMAANLKAGYSYCGAKNISELWNNAKFIRISSSGMRESAAHDVVILKD